jgi:hypothetical protein
MADHDRLSQLFAAYREACPDPEPSAGFTPALWEKIEASRVFVFRWKRLSQAIITAAAAVCLMMGLYQVRPAPLSETYLEVLASDQSSDSPADEQIVQVIHERN